MASNRLLLLPDGPEARAALLALIAEARHEIRMLYYIFEADEIGHAIRDALLEAVHRGVKVWLIVDGFGSYTTPRSFFEPLQRAGAHFCRFEPHWGRRYLLRNHQKMTVADDSAAIIGGFNIADNYFDPNRRDSWRDLGVRIDGPAVEHLSGYFDRLFAWTTSKHATFRGLRRLVLRETQTTGPLRWIISGPLRRASAYARQLRADLARGRRLDLLMAYFAPNRRVLRQIRRIAAEGEARIVTAAKTDVPMARLAAWATFGRLLAAGVRIFEYQPRALHAKLIIIDDIVYIGSANLDMRSLYINLEVMLRIEDAEFAAKMRNLFEQDLAQSREIDLATHARAATWFNRLRWRCAYFIIAGLDLFVARRLAS